MSKAKSYCAESYICKDKIYPNSFTVPFRGPPHYNPKRRSGIGWFNVNIGTNANFIGTLTRRSVLYSGHLNGPPSPCPSEQMAYSSASSSLSEGSLEHRSHEDDMSIVTGTVYCL